MKNNSSGEANPTSGEVCRSVRKVVITLISSSVHGCLWSFQGRVEWRWKSGLGYGWLCSHSRSKISLSLITEDKEKIISPCTMKIPLSVFLSYSAAGLHLNKPPSNRGSMHQCMCRSMRIWLPWYIVATKTEPRGSKKLLKMVIRLCMELWLFNELINEVPGV